MNAIDELRRHVASEESKLESQATGYRPFGSGFYPYQACDAQVVEAAILELADRIRHIEERATFPTKGD